MGLNKDVLLMVEEKRLVGYKGKEESATERKPVARWATGKVQLTARWSKGENPNLAAKC